MQEVLKSHSHKQFWSEILPQVERPSRYLGTEWNAVHKDLNDIKLRIALAFPDLYELGLGNLGLQILYSLLNKQPHIWAERVYAPAPDLEQVLRKENCPLFLWESKDSVRQCDLLGFTLQSELTYTTVLNILDLSHIPIYAKERTSYDPLICAGGPCCFNPEPMSPFIDFFVIGEGEEVILQIADLLIKNKDLTREKKLELLSNIEGIYVPEVFNAVSHSFPPQKKIHRAIVKTLSIDNYIDKYIVPFTPLVHEGLSIEIMRGCTRGCRFCFAGCTFRPVRERTPEEVETIITSLLPNTGLETVTLVSLSTCDYSQIQQLLNQTRQITQPTTTSISLPSLRLDSFSVMLADSVSAVRRSGLTFAPEAGSERLRKLINKTVTNDDLMEIIRIAFRRGWTHVKLYFMIGLPTEMDEDIDALIDLSIQCLNTAKKVRYNAHIHLGISTFVPKSWTPFQWARQISLEETREKQKRILNGLKKYKAIKISFHEPESSFIEGILSRADIRISEVIKSAWEQGANLETSADKVSLERWMQALEKQNLRAEDFLRERNEDEPLPWDFIDPGIDKEWLHREWEKAHQYDITPDCREANCNLCGIQRRNDLQCLHLQKEKVETLTKDKNPNLPLAASESNSSVQRLLLKVSKLRAARFLSHLEFQTAWIRVFRRTQLPVAYSQGFHAHAHISIALPAPVGETLLEEYIETKLTSEMNTEEVLQQLSLALPDGFFIYSVDSIPKLSPSVMERVAGVQYAMVIQANKLYDKSHIDQIIDYMHSQLEQVLSDKGNIPPDKLEIITHEILNTPSIEFYSEKNCYLIQWLTPVVKGKFLKPKHVKEYMKEIGLPPPPTTQTFRVKTYLDNVPSNSCPIPTEILENIMFISTEY